MQSILKTTRKIAIHFSQLIINSQFKEAYSLLTPTLQASCSQEDMVAQYEDMIESFDFKKDTLYLTDTDDLVEVNIFVSNTQDLGKTDIDDILASVSIMGMVRSDEGEESFESYTVFRLGFDYVDGKGLMIADVLFDGRA